MKDTLGSTLGEIVQCVKPKASFAANFQRYNLNYKIEITITQVCVGIENTTVYHFNT